MIARCVSTALVFLLALYAFWGNALGAGRIFNPFGLLFLLFTYVIWFKWEIVRDAFASAKGESNVPIIRLGYNIIEGLSAKHRPDPASSERPPHET